MTCEVDVGRRTQIANAQAQGAGIGRCEPVHYRVHNGFGVHIEERGLGPEGDHGRRLLVLGVAIKVGIAVRPGYATKEGDVGM